MDIIPQINANFAPAFCNCTFPEIPYHPIGPEILNSVKCRCGENDDLHKLHWTWQEPDNSDIHVRGQDVIFHPCFSQGTIGVRGAELAVGMVHFWEIRMISTLTGTDIMFGVGTDEVSFEPYKFIFVSALGLNSQSWGYSFHGFVQHNRKHRYYGQRFSQGSVLGILLDRTRGHLEYYLNRRPLGIAFRNIPMDPSVKLYPIVCSTAAKSIVRLINSISEPECLQLQAYRRLSQTPKSMKDLQEMPGLRSIVRTYWFFAPEIYSKCCNKHELDIADEAVISKKRLLRMQKFTDNFNEDSIDGGGGGVGNDVDGDNDDDDDDDIYANAHKIYAAASDSDDELMPNGMEWMMDEYFNRLP